MLCCIHTQKFEEINTLGNKLPDGSVNTATYINKCDFYDASLTKGVTETVNERLQKAEEVLRLRRTKPLKAWESTLDACINLKIKT
jgi:hypothetical protein